MDHWNGKVARPSASFLIDPYILVLEAVSEPNSDQAVKSKERGALTLDPDGRRIPARFHQAPQEDRNVCHITVGENGGVLHGISAWMECIGADHPHGAISSYLQNMEGNVTEWAHNVQVELDLGGSHDFNLPV